MDLTNNCFVTHSENKEKWIDSGSSLNRRLDFMPRNIKSTNSKNPPI